MALNLDCAVCSTDEHVELVATLTGTQRRLRCTQCGHEWLRGEPAHVVPALPTLHEIKSRFPGPGDVDPARLARAADLKTEFLRERPQPEPDVAPYWAKYQRIFSAEGLPHADPRDLKDFANNGTGAHPGNMSVFNDAWNAMGEEAAAAQVRRAIDYLLRGPEDTALEDRLSRLIDDSTPHAMRGFKESLLTKVLCVVYPDRFLPILKYSGRDGKDKKGIAHMIWGLELPEPERVQWTLGRLIIWSNELLLALIGDGFQTQQHAAGFLWWAKDRA